VIQAHIEFFHEIGAVPESIFYDRMSVVYDSQKQQLNETFLDFSMHSGFRLWVWDLQVDIFIRHV
jgi:transposase